MSLYLFKQFLLRDIALRYKGSFLGFGWVVIWPLVMLAVYSFVFSVIFESRWANGDSANFPIILFIGLTVHGFFSESITRSTSIISENVNLVKKIVFPLVIFSPIVVSTALFHLLVSFVVIFIFTLLLNGLSLSVLLVPFILLPFILLTIGVGWVLSSLGVFLRDLRHIITALTSILLFLSPIFYPIENIPADLRLYIYINPLSFIVETLRDVVVFNVAVNWWHYSLYTICSLVIFFIGHFIFKKSKNSFSDIL